jgi:hypothetical protein
MNDAAPQQRLAADRASSMEARLEEVIRPRRAG